MFIYFGTDRRPRGVFNQKHWQAPKRTLSFARPRALRALGLACFGHSRALRALEWPYPMSIGPSGNTAAGACQRPDIVTYFDTNAAFLRNFNRM